MPDCCLSKDALTVPIPSPVVRYIAFTDPLFLRVNRNLRGHGVLLSPNPFGDLSGKTSISPNSPVNTRAEHALSKLKGARHT